MQKKKRMIGMITVIAMIMSLMFSSNIMAATTNSGNLTGQFVTRLYKTVFNREPDPVGYNNWVKRLTTHDCNGATIAEGFFCSDELTKKNISDEAFINLLYQALFDRASDPAGFAYWKDMLANGLSRRFALKGFIESAEFTNLCEKYQINRGNITLTEYREKNPNVTKFVSRCYKLVLGRTADINGLNDWTHRLLSGQEGAGKVAYGFFSSDEFTNKKLSNSDYVKLLYQVLMDRTYDQAGLNNWVGELASGASRYHVFLGFANSTEFSKICARYGVSVGKLDPEKPATPGGSSGSSGGSSGSSGGSSANAYGSNTTVYISATGSNVYHRINNCRNMNPATAHSMTKGEAEAKGYRPCKNCWH